MKTRSITHRRAEALRFTLLTALGALPLNACGGNTSESGGAGGRAGSGGTAANGGGYAKGGGFSNGGGYTEGGAQASGGATGLGGALATNGGASPTGGAQPFGGANTTGGAQPFGGASTTGGASGGANTTGGASSKFPCENPMPVPGDTTGTFEVCAGGWKHRTAVRECPSSLPRSRVLPPSRVPNVDACTSDADCTAQANGHCEPPTLVGADLPVNSCWYGCVRDADCGASGAICECGDPVGTCVAARCVSDADCGGAGLCATYDSEPGCDIIAYACQTPMDVCAADADCPNLQECSIKAGSSARVCQSQNCAIGRPFLVGGAIRCAAAIERADWAERSADSDDVLRPEAREALAHYWARIGSLEHASIAAFARFNLELLSFGAPAELIELTNRALADETLHAKLAFSLASRYQGALLGPGPLDMRGAVIHATLLESVLAAFEEGCIGETVAALEAARALEGSTDEAVRAALTRIADDEARHAELAYRYLRWALPQLGPEIARELVRRVERECENAAQPGRSVTHDPTLSRHGLLSPEESQGVRRAALVEVVLPCVRALAQNTAGSVYVPNTERSTSQISCRLA
ncbi:MAG TPA: ferritin-like domain-containing protein [Polyangiaceae bacterium]|nr:ferritin-like domain-containing protein [Polyangiaceae bacterium]